MPRLLKSIFLISLFLFFCLTFVFAEDITITSYYPSPYGSYRELRTVKQGIGATYSSRGTVCWDPPCPIGSTDVSVSNPDLLIEGNVGIGTTSPLAKLHVEETGSGSLNVLRVVENGAVGGAIAHISLDNTAGTADALYVRHRGTGNLLKLANNDGIKVLIDNSGNVGIGTTNPGQMLTLVGGNLRIIGLATAFSADVGLQIGGSRGSPDIGNIVFGDGTGWKLHFAKATDNAATKFVTIQDNGNVGIGTTNPLGKLDVNGAIFQRGASLHADYVFEPAYKLESIEDHSAYMWQNKHLKAVPVATKDEKGQDIVNWGERNRGVLEELEKAHVYIQQLNERIKALETKPKDAKVK